MAQSQQDITSVLSKVQGLEDEKARLIRLLDEERERVKDALAKADKLSEGKRSEMRQALDTVIMNWLRDSVKDEKVREEFKNGMDRLVENTAEDSGVWQVVCCASNLHAQRLQELEQMRIENDNLKLRSTGEFREDNSRKRERDDPATDSSCKGNIWYIFFVYCFVTFLVDTLLIDKSRYRTEFEAEIRTGRTFGTGL